MGKFIKEWVLASLFLTAITTITGFILGFLYGAAKAAFIGGMFIWN